MRASASLAILAAVLLLAACKSTPSEPAVSAVRDGAPRPWISDAPEALAGFEIIGHRGARGYFPENTLPGFRSALRLGVSAIEIDVAMTRDGLLVAHHDLWLDPDRTRGPDGRWLDGAGPALVAVTFDELKPFDVGAAKPGSLAATSFPQQRAFDHVGIPPLTTVLLSAEQLSDRRARYFVETKLSPLSADISPPPDRFAATLVADLRQAGVADRTTVQSFDWRTLLEVQQIAPEIATAYLTVEQKWLDTVERNKPRSSPWLAGLDVDDHGGSLPALVKAAGGAVWAPYFADLGAEELAEAHGLGLRVVVWTVDEPVAMRRMLALGVDGIVTDFPDVLRAIREGFIVSGGTPTMPGAPVAVQ